MKYQSSIKKIIFLALMILLWANSQNMFVVSGSGGNTHVHSWGSATCTRPATCGICGATSGSALGHNIETTGYTATGSTISHRVNRSCTRCGMNADASEAHRWGGWYTATSPTCTSAGVSARSCGRCGQSETSSIPALGHSWNSSWSTNDSAHWHVCNRCSATKDYGNHADTNYNGYCNTCGYQMYHLVTIPTVTAGEFTYNGQNQSPSFYNPDSSHTSITGNTQVDAGTYTARITLAHSNDKWRGEYSASNTSANGAKTYTWKINQKHINVVWGEIQVFEADGTNKMRSASVNTGVNGETMTITLTTYRSQIGQYAAHAAAQAVTGGRAKTTNYYLDNADSTFRIIDTTKPSVTVNASGTTWTNQNVVFTINASDAGTGIKKLEYSMDTVTWRSDFDAGSTTTNAKKTFTTDQNSVVYFRAIDNVENISVIQGPFKIQIDKTVPTFTIEKSPNGDWTNTSVDLKVVSNDNIAVSQIKIGGETQTNAVDLGTTNGLVTSKEATKTYTDNQNNIAIVITDLAGNQTTGTASVTNIEKIKPTITVPGENAGTITNNKQQIVLRDNVAPNSKMKYIGVSKTNVEPTVLGTSGTTLGDQLDVYYQVPNNDEVTFNFTFSEEGTYTIFARDLAGNVQTKQVNLSYTDISSDSNIQITLNQERPYLYDGFSHNPQETVKNLRSGTNLVKNVDYKVEITDNVNAGTATVTIIGIGEYKGSKSINFEIAKRDLNIVPNEGQNKLRMVNDPTFTFTYNNQVVGEVPEFSGALSRDASEDVGTYNITLGSLTLVDNGRFLANNYQIVFTSGIEFEISEFSGLKTTWKIPANGTVVLPIPAGASNKYQISWGDGNYDSITTQAFPSHTYENTAEQEYTIIVAGDVKVFGYINDVKPTTTNTASNYVSFNNYLVGIQSFGDINASRIGFSYCSNLIGTIPTSENFDTLTSAENMFNECSSLTGPIPNNFLSHASGITSAKNMFNGCSSLTGTLTNELFAGCSKIISFENTFRGCSSITGNLIDDMFKDSVKAQSFAGTFANMSGIRGEIPNNLFRYNVEAKNFSETFANDTGITVIGEDLFKNNLQATNFYRTFYKNTGINNIPTMLFRDNPIGAISNEPNSKKDFRGTFEDCTGVREARINSKFIGMEMFKGCTALERVLFLNAIEIGDAAFYGCNKLTNIKVSNNNFAAIGEDVFEYTGSNPPLLTYINKQNSLLLDYDWPADNRIIDTNAPKGTVQIVKDTYPFTNTEEVQLQITLEDDISDPSNCYIAILNDTAYKEFTPEEIANAASANESLEVFNWEPYVENKTWTLTAGDEVKTVYVYFRDEMGNISFVTQILDLVPQEYTITYKTSDSSVQNMPQAQSAPMDQDITITNQKPTKPNRGFIGWSKTVNSTNVDYRPGDVYVDRTSIVLYPVWVDGYNMIYYPNGGANAPSSDRKQVGEPYTISSQVPTREGYDFQGWARTGTATVAEYQPGDQYTIDENTIFWAVWKIQKYQITFNANGGVQSSCPEGFEKAYAQSVLLSKTIPVRDGFIFEGWARDNPNATSPNYSVASIQNESVMFAENYSCVLYAVWRVGEYNVFFNANGGSNAPSSGRKIGGQPYIIPSQVPTREGYDFQGWARTSTATVAEYQPGDQYTINENTTFWAVWKIKKYQITFNANGGVQSSCPEGFEKAYAQSVLLSKTIPVRDGFIFEGWARDNPNATSPNYSVASIQNESVMFAENYSCVLYAVWRVGEYNVFFNANGGSNAPSSGRKIGGQPYIIPSQRPTKWDKNFGGWATSSTATVAEYQPGDEYTRNEEVTFYAVWVN